MISDHNTINVLAKARETLKRIAQERKSADTRGIVYLDELENKLLHMIARDLMEALRMELLSEKESENAII